MRGTDFPQYFTICLSRPFRPQLLGQQPPPRPLALLAGHWGDRRGVRS